MPKLSQWAEVSVHRSRLGHPMVKFQLLDLVHKAEYLTIRDIYLEYLSGHHTMLQEQGLHFSIRAHDVHSFSARTRDSLMRATNRNLTTCPGFRDTVKVGNNLSAALAPGEAHQQSYRQIMQGYAPACNPNWGVIKSQIGHTGQFCQ
jgi:hypothetical protein